MHPMIKEYMNSGRPLDEILDEKIKDNNRKWFTLTLLLSVIWIGYICTINSRNIELVQKVNSNDSLLGYQSKVIEMQKEALDSAVFFSEIVK